MVKLIAVLMFFTTQLWAAQCQISIILLRQDFGRGVSLTEEMKVVGKNPRLVVEFPRWENCYDLAREEALKSQFSIKDSQGRHLWYITTKWKLVSGTRVTSWGFVNNYTAINLYKTQRYKGAALVDMVGSPMGLNEIIEEVFKQVPELI